VHTLTRAHAGTHTFTHTYTYTFTHTHTHTHITHTNTRTLARPLPPALQVSCYHELIACDKEIVKSILRLTGGIEGIKAQVRTCAGHGRLAMRRRPPLPPRVRRERQGGCLAPATVCRVPACLPAEGVARAHAAAWLPRACGLPASAWAC